MPGGYRHPNIYKVLVMVLYHSYAWLNRDPWGLIEIKSDGLTRALICKAETTRALLRSLERHGYIRDLQMGRGWASLRVNPPMPPASSGGLLV